MKKRQAKKNLKKLLNKWESFEICGTRFSLALFEVKDKRRLHVGEYEEIFR